MHRRHFESELPGFLFGAILILVGAYYLLTRTFGMDLPQLDWDQIWPLFVIALGAGILWRALVSRTDAGGR